MFQFPTRYDGDIFKLADKTLLRETYGIPQEQISIVTVGRLNWFKGWKFMIDSFMKFLPQKNVHLYFLGDGEDKENVQNYINKQNVAEYVTLVGVLPLTKVAEYLAMSDLFIMGSYKEGWSTSLVEAVACGIPCVVTDFSSAEDMVKDGENGFVVRERDEQLFYEKMCKALEIDHNIILQYAERNRKYSVQNMRKELNKILRFDD